MDGRSWTGEIPTQPGRERQLDSANSGTLDLYLPKTGPVGPMRDTDDFGVYEGRFAVTGVLKRGPGVTTLTGQDRETNQAVVIKSVPLTGIPRPDQLRLEHEGMVLRSLRHAAVVPLVHMGRDHGHLYVVTPRVEGVDLAARLGRGALSLMETLAVASDVLRALQEAHGLGIVHRDIKPANVIVAEGVVTGARVVDFGLSWSPELNAGLRDAHVGTARYMAPEQAGLIERPVTAASDLYAVGALLYECLVGRPAFDGETIGKVLRQHLSARPRRMRALGLNVPRALDEIVQRLFRSDPRERYQTATSALEDLSRLSRRLEAGEADPALVIGLGDRRESLTEADFVGRAQEMVQLRAELYRAASGEGALALLSALSGGGKTRLLAELCVVAEQSGVRVFRGQATDHAARLPLQIFAGVVAELHADSAFAAEVRERLGDELEGVCEAFPDLTEVLRPREEILPGREEHGAVRTSRAVAQLLQALGSAKRPALIALDDCQWADGQSVEVLAEWRREFADAESHVMVVAAYRSEEVAQDASLLALRATAHVAIAPLTAASVRSLAESMAGKLPEVALDTVVRLSEGSPFLSAAVLRGLVETGALAHRDGHWQMDPDALADVQSSRRAAVLLSRRLDLLPEEVLEVLTVCAVLGKEFELAEAARLVGLPSADVAGALSVAAERHIVWFDAEDGAGAFLHDKLREALLARLDAEQLGALHLRAAEGLEAEGADAVFALAYHFDAAGAVDRALPYAVSAAEKARELHGLDVAERYYRIALRAPSLPRETERVLNQGLGTVLMLQGRYAEAGGLLQRAREQSESSYDSALVDARLGELAFKQGDMDAASLAIERGLRSLGRFVPTSKVTFLVLVAWEGAVQLMHTLLPRLFLGRRDLAEGREDLLAVRLYSRLAYPYWFQHGIVEALWTLLREVNLAERFPRCPELAQAYANHGVAMTVPGWFDRGVAYARRGLEMRRQLHDLWGEGQSQAFLSIVLYAGARVEEAESAGREAIRLLERTGDRWEHHTAGYHVGLSLLRQGRFEEALAIGRRLHHDGLDGGDMQAIGEGVELWSKATGGRVPAQVVGVELGRHLEDKQTRSLVLQAEAVRQLGVDDLDGAVKTLEEAMIIGRDLSSDYVAPVPCWLATAHRRIAESVPAWDPQRRRAHLAAATKAAKAGLKRARQFRNNLPHALRELGLLAAMRGHARKARKLLDRSVAAAVEVRAHYEVAQSRHARAVIARDLGWDDVAGELEESELARRSMTIGPLIPSGEPRATLSLMDRFSTLLDVGRQVATALTREDVFAAARDATRTLLRAESCSVVALREESVEILAGDGRFDVSLTVLRRALDKGEVVLTSTDVGASAAESVVLSEVRSALCVPIQVRGERTLCLYATTSQLSDLYGDEDERLAEFVASITGAALENAIALEELEATQRQLMHSGKLAAVGTLMTSLSHEINNPLAVVIGYAQTLLVTTPATHPDRAALEAIEREANRCARLVQTLLTFSRKDVGKKEWVPVSALFNAVPELLAGRARRRRVQLELSDGKGLPPLFVNVTAVESCLVNVVKNALDATPAGGRVVVDAQVATREGRLGVTITVEDDGAGIDSDVLPRIFEPFFTTKASGRGTGLGLSLVRKIVDGHGGLIELDSKVGVGTTARIWFPAEDGA